MTDQVFEAAVRAKIAKAENAADGWRKEALELSKEIKSLRQQLAECDKYMKENETPAQRMKRYHHDVVQLIRQLATVTAERDELVAALKDQIDLGDGDVAVTARAALAKLGADKTGEQHE